MGKMIGIAEFKANCTRLLREMEHDGQPITVTKRGKPVAELRPMAKERARLTFGCMKHPSYRFDDPDTPAYDQPWNAELGILGDED